MNLKVEMKGLKTYKTSGMHNIYDLVFRFFQK
jgi:hypothetical protein